MIPDPVMDVVDSIEPAAAIERVGVGKLKIRVVTGAASRIVGILVEDRGELARIAAVRKCLMALFSGHRVDGETSHGDQR